MPTEKERDPIYGWIVCGMCGSHLESGDGHNDGCPFLGLVHESVSSIECCEVSRRSRAMRRWVLVWLDGHEETISAESVQVRDGCLSIYADRSVRMIPIANLREWREIDR
jgi:hypothetical protein